MFVDVSLSKGNNDSKTVNKDTINSENNKKVKKTVLITNDSLKKNKGDVCFN